MKYRCEGFTLIELMIVVSIIAFLSMLSVPNLMKILAKAKRSEAYMYLRTLAQAQKVYYAEHGTYTTNLSGPDSLCWEPEGEYNYTYGFAGTRCEVGHFIGKLGTPASALSAAHISHNGFTLVAAGTIYGDGIDCISINEKGVVTLINDSLK